MKIKIVGIVDRGLANKERLHLIAEAPANLNFYAVFSTVKLDSDSIVSAPKHAFWFADFHVNAGDHVILYTKSGEDFTKPRSDGKKNHFFYWSLDKTIWGAPESCAVLLEISDWQTSI